MVLSLAMVLGSIQYTPMAKVQAETTEREYTYTFNELVNHDYVETLNNDGSVQIKYNSKAAEAK